MAYYSKITFAYAIVIPFMVRFLQFLSDRIQARHSSGSLCKDWAVQSGVAAFLGGAFYFNWYKPNQSIFDMVKANQGSGRYDIGDAWSRFSLNLNEFVLIDGLAPFAILLALCLILLLFTKNIKDNKQLLMFGFLSWFVLELHHMLLVNPPTRYLIPLYFSSLALIAFSFSENVNGGLKRAVVYLSLVLFGAYNLNQYWESLERRTFSIAEGQRLPESI